MYIGMYDTDRQEVHTWADGALVNYTNFVRGRPNDMAKQAVIMKSDGYWRDVDESGKFGYVCRKPSRE